MTANDPSTDTAAAHVAAALGRLAPGPGSAVALVAKAGRPAVVTRGVEDVISRSPVTEDSVFQVGSISKSITAAALLRLADRGAIDLDRPVAHYLPWFDAGDGAVISVRHLMMHTAGLVGFVDTVPASRLAVWSLRDTAWAGDAGRRFHYSNMGYLALGYVLERVAATTFAAALADLVFTPLGMDRSVAAIGTGTAKAVSGHVWNESHRRHEPVAAVDMVGAHASVCCPPGDLARFVQMLVGRGGAGGARFLSRGAFATMVAPGPATGGEWRYGCGLFVGRPASWGGGLMVHHGGENPGFEAAMLADLGEGIGAVAMANSHASPWPAVGHALRTLGAARRGEPLPEAPALQSTSPPPRPPAADSSGRWPAVAGHYRAHAPLLTDYRVLARADGLVLESNGDFEQALTPLDGLRFRIGDAPNELAEFDVVIDGRAQRARIGGGVYARVDTP